MEVNAIRQIQPGNISNQRYEMNLQLQKYFDIVNRSPPSKQVTEWKNKEEKSPIKVFYDDRKRTRDTKISKNNKILTERIEAIKSNNVVDLVKKSQTPTADLMFKTFDSVLVGRSAGAGNRMINGKTVIDCRRLDGGKNLMNILHGFKRKEMIRQQKIMTQNQKLFSFFNNARTAYDIKGFEVEHEKNQKIRSMIQNVHGNLLFIHPSKKNMSQNKNQVRPKSALGLSTFSTPIRQITSEAGNDSASVAVNRTNTLPAIKTTESFDGFELETPISPSKSRSFVLNPVKSPKLGDNIQNASVASWIREESQISQKPSLHLLRPMTVPVRETISSIFSNSNDILSPSSKINGSNFNPIETLDKYGDSLIFRFSTSAKVDFSFITTEFNLSEIPNQPIDCLVSVFSHSSNNGFNEVRLVSPGKSSTVRASSAKTPKVNTEENNRSFKRSLSNKNVGISPERLWNDEDSRVEYSPTRQRIQNHARSQQSKLGTSERVIPIGISMNSKNVLKLQVNIHPISTPDANITQILKAFSKTRVDNLLDHLSLQNSNQNSFTSSTSNQPLNYSERLNAEILIPIRQIQNLAVTIGMVELNKMIIDFESRSKSNPNRFTSDSDSFTAQNGNIIDTEDLVDIDDNILDNKVIQSMIRELLVRVVEITFKPTLCRLAIRIKNPYELKLVREKFEDFYAVNTMLLMEGYVGAEYLFRYNRVAQMENSEYVSLIQSASKMTRLLELLTQNIHCVISVYPLKSEVVKAQSPMFKTQSNDNKFKDAWSEFIDSNIKLVAHVHDSCNWVINEFDDIIKRSASSNTSKDRLVNNEIMKSSRYHPVQTREAELIIPIRQIQNIAYSLGETEFYDNITNKLNATSMKTGNTERVFDSSSMMKRLRDLLLESVEIVFKPSINRITLHINIDK